MTIWNRSQADGVGAGISVVVVADVRLYREGLNASLATRPGLTVVGAAPASEVALAVVTSARPDVVVLDVASRGSLGIARAIADAEPEVRIVAFAIAEADREILACAEAGVAAWVPCDGSIDDLVSTIEHVVHDELVCSPKLASTLFRRLASLARQVPQRGPVDDLTGRERQILGLIDRGLSNKEIAVRLSVEVTTVKNHVHNILEKLHVRRRNEAAAFVRAALPGPRSMLRGGD